MREISELVEVFLSLADVPMEAFRKGIEPVGDLFLSADARYRINGGCDAQAVAVAEFLAVAAVKGHPRGVAALRRHRYP